MIQCLLKKSFSEFICEKLLKCLKGYLKLESLDMEKLYLGIMIITLNIVEMTFIFTISFFMGILKGVILFFVMFAALRCTAAGVHCKSSLMCVFITSICHIGSTYISMNYPLNISLNIIVSIICTIFLYKYSPADTENRPILGEEHRRELKIKTTITALTLISINLLLLNKTLFNLTMFVLIIQTISVLPCTYKLMKINYNNYKKYEKSRKFI